MYAKKLCKDFKINNLDKCHNLYVQSNKLFLAGIFEKFRNMFLQIYKLDPAHFLLHQDEHEKQSLKRLFN